MAYTTIDNPELYFQVKLFTGNGSTQSLTLDGDEDMQPDLLWFKQRDGTGNHAVFDAVRGTTGSVYRRLITEGDGAEDTAANTLTTIGSDGFTVGSDGNINGSSDTMVAWCWKESATAGFDIATFTGSGGTQNISHSLSAVPEMIITKSRSASGAWYTYHAGVASDAETDFLKLNETEAAADNASVWNDTAPTTSVFTVGSAFDNTTTFVAYAFASKQGFSKFGSYTGNGNADGAFVYTGFAPAFVMVKSTATAEGWIIIDNKRKYNVATNFLGNPKGYPLYAQSNAAEAVNTWAATDLLSNGFKLRVSHGQINDTSNFIYMAFAEAPFVNSNGVPCNAR